MENRKLSPTRLLIFGFILLAAVSGLVFAGITVSNMLFPKNAPTSQQPPQTSPTAKSSSGSAQAFPTFTPTGKGSNTTMPEPQAQATDPATIPGAAQTDGSNPVLCQPGTALTKLTVTADSYAGFYPLFYRIAAMPASSHYCIVFMPKWSGPNYDQYGLEESQIELALRDGTIDVYFASNGAIALYDANSAKVIWTTDQSAGADQIIARNDVASNGNKPSFNDILGRSIITSQGGADHFLTLKMMQTIGFTPDMVNVIFPQSGSGDPADNFNNGNGQFVAYWEPLVSKAQNNNSTVLISTKWWRTISDYVVVSNQAFNGKEEAVTYFLADLNAATQAFTVENLPKTAQVLANFQFEGNNMADWLWLDKNDPAGSLTKLMNSVALASLNDNVAMFEETPAGNNLVEDQIVRSHNTWLFGGINNNGNTGSLFNQTTLVSDKFVKILLNSGMTQISGQFSNKYDTDVSQKPPQVDESTLINLPVLLTLPYTDIKFVEGYSNQLIPGEAEKLISMVSSIANMMAESDNSVIVIKGGVGYYPTGETDKANATNFAFRRAQFIQRLLADSLHIPIQRIVLDRTVIMPDHEITDPAELKQYMVVVIKVVNTQAFK